MEKETKIRRQTNKEEEVSRMGGRYNLWVAASINSGPKRSWERR